MKIDLSIITKSINKELTQEADISLTSFRSRLGDFPIVRKAPVTLQIRNEENAAVFVKGTVDIDVMIPCARCLEEVRTPIRFDINSRVGLLNSTFRFSAEMKSLFWKSASLLWSSATFTAGICVMSALSKGHHADTVIGSRLVQ